MNCNAVGWRHENLEFRDNDAISTGDKWPNVNIGTKQNLA
jgi:hypothetical protein